MSCNTSGQDDEHAPLLRDCSYVGPTHDLAAVKQSIQTRTKLATLFFVCILYFNAYICLAPESRIREEIICKAYYEGLDREISADPSKQDCTIDGIQKELNLVTQLYMTFSQLPGKRRNPLLRRCDNVLQIFVPQTSLRPSSLIRGIGFVLALPYGVMSMCIRHAAL